MLLCVNIPGLRAGGDPVPASGIICALSVSPRPKQTRLCQEVHPATQTSPKLNMRLHLHWRLHLNEHLKGFFKNFINN